MLYSYHDLSTVQYIPAKLARTASSQMDSDERVAPLSEELDTNSDQDVHALPLCMVTPCIFVLVCRPREPIVIRDADVTQICCTTGILKNNNDHLVMLSHSRKAGREFAVAAFSVLIVSLLTRMNRTKLPLEKTTRSSASTFQEVPTKSVTSTIPRLVSVIRDRQA